VDNDENQKKVLIIGLKLEDEFEQQNDKMKLVIKLINTQIGHRTSFIDEKNKLSDMNSRLRWI